MKNGIYVFVYLHGCISFLCEPLEVFWGFDSHGHGLIDFLDGIVMLSLHLNSKCSFSKQNSRTIQSSNTLLETITNSVQKKELNCQLNCRAKNQWLFWYFFCSKIIIYNILNCSEKLNFGIKIGGFEQCVAWKKAMQLSSISSFQFHKSTYLCQGIFVLCLFS